MMEINPIHRLVVEADDDPSRPIGLLSTTDLIHAISEERAGNPTPPEEAEPDG